MRGWTMPIQRASYRGVRFDVFNVDDSLERAVIEHSYPFVNGADLEDLGLNPLKVRMSAVFYGEGYFTQFKKCLEQMKKQGPDVLVHPIRGRLPNMLCVSMQFHHDAEYADYVTLDLVFREATPAKPIFLDENGLLSKIDALLNQLEDFIDEVQGLFATVIEYVAFARNVKERLLGGAVFGVYEQLRDLFDIDQGKFSLSPHINSAIFQSQTQAACKDILTMVELGLTQIAERVELTPRAKFEEVLRSIKTVEGIPAMLVSGATVQSLKPSRVATRTNTLSAQDVKEVRCVLQLACSASLVKIATDFMQDSTLLPSDIEYAATKVRLQILKTLNSVRTLAKEERPSVDFSVPNTGLYTQTHLVSEGLRKQGQYITQLALAAINRKPPLIVRTVEIDGTIQQVAHVFYGDYRRAQELLRLNAHIRQPNFIQRGEVLNSYAR
ncbi:phage morphogenesis protein [[Haemophilus] felis]|uniref:Phage morphogenesis protein n=1 Tax=[Haemophilus] felis TaxID=123822 RepID=A0A1T0BAY5_9PAST|nr:phage morphogenesis protein [[Haemophilus] felis]OOS07079.1 phage morphogenesis protein [[Haemophilus] felis]